MKKTARWSIGFISAMLMAWLGNYFYDRTKEVPVLKYVTGFLNWIYEATLNVMNYPLKVWIVLLSLLVIMGILALYSKMQGNSYTPPEFTQYKEDVFKKWRWRWDWKLGQNGWKIVNLTAYCPNDDVQLVNQSSVLERRFYCPKCETIYHDYYQPVENAVDAEVLIIAEVKKRFPQVP
jgi:hypothetical protein